MHLFTKITLVTLGLLCIFIAFFPFVNALDIGVSGGQKTCNDIFCNLSDDLIYWVNLIGKPDFNKPFIDYIDFNTLGGFSTQQGRVSWDVDNNTLQVGLNSNVNLQLGQEQVLLVKNVDSVAWTDGNIVYVSGSTGTNISAKLADADTYSSHDTIGMATEPCAVNQICWITTYGVVHGLNTNSLTAGDILYLSQDAGKWTNNIPVAPVHTVRIGNVIRKNINNGEVFVNIQNGFDLNMLDDVNTLGKVNNDVLTFDSTSSTWKAKTFPTSDINLSYANSTYAKRTDVNSWGDARYLPKGTTFSDTNTQTMGLTDSLGNFLIDGNFGEHSVLAKDGNFTYLNLKNTKIINLNDGLVAHYLLNDNTSSTDIVDTKGNNGIAQQESQYLTTTGKINSAISFNQSTDYVSIPYNSIYDFASNDFTFTTWFYMTDNSPQQTIFASDTDFKIGIFYAGYTDQRLYYFVSSDGYSWDLIAGDAGVLNGKGTNTISMNTWHFLTFKRNGNNWIGTLDGVTDLSVTLSGTVTYREEPFVLGRWGADGDRKYNGGKLDDFRYYNRALTSEEINAIYNSGNGTESETNTTTITNSTMYVDENGDWHIPSNSNFYAKNINNKVDVNQIIPQTTYGTLSYPQFNAYFFGVKEDYTLQLDNEMSGTVAHYKMNDDAGTTTITDSTGNHNANSTANTNLITTTGKINKALNFSAQSSYGSIPYDSAFDYSYSYPFSITAWIYADNSGVSRSIVNQYNTMDGWSLYLAGSNQLNFYNNSYDFVTTATFNIGQWNHVVITHDGYGTYQLCINASCENKYESVPTTNYGNILIGYEPRLGDSYTRGLDDLRFFNYVISQDTINTIYNSGSGYEESEGGTATNLSLISLDNNEVNFDRNTVTNGVNKAESFEISAGGTLNGRIDSDASYVNLKGGDYRVFNSLLVDNNVTLEFLLFNSTNFITSFATGYIDYVSTTLHRFYGNVLMNNDLNVNGNIYGDNNIQADYFIGDGSKLTNINDNDSNYLNKNSSNVETIKTDLNINRDLNIGRDLRVDGNSYLKIPYGTYTSTKTQTVGSAGVKYYMDFNTTEDVYMVRRMGDTNFGVSVAGDYMINISVIATSTIAGKRVNVWVEKNGVAVPRSNTPYDFKTTGAVAIISVPFILDLNTTDRFSIMYEADSTAVTLPYIAGSGVVPETPSSIITFYKIGEDMA